ncbi:putative DEOR-type transcriptional regulator [Klebsiella pneumoniae]|uniref:Putative DEOR-type transcriptional regulator n=1 Tax=Klebsiella pneumoniae TaxID=573 RepID=A0A378A569_KLEPN|nr:putative DEOR-type transcriptional regulator [Klebsiella pneumoniae]
MAKPSTSLLKRRLDIAEIVRKNGEIKVDDLAEMLAVSGVTIRNDLNYLEQQGYLKRSFGGAIYTAQAGAPVAMTREALPSEIKRWRRKWLARWRRR